MAYSNVISTHSVTTSTIKWTSGQFTVYCTTGLLNNKVEGRVYTLPGATQDQDPGRSYALRILGDAKEARILRYQDLILVKMTSHP